MIKEEIRWPKSEREEANFLSTLWNGFFPFWPLFAGLSIAFLIPAWVYSLSVKPAYIIKAALVISDEGKRTGETPGSQSINIYPYKKVVDNEVQVLQSRTLMDEVVMDLALYAAVYEKSVSAVSAYTSSPVTIRVKDPHTIRAQKEIPYEYDEVTKRVKINGKWYGLDQWVALSFGVVKFEANSQKKHPVKHPLFFSLVHPAKITESILRKLQVLPVDEPASVIIIQYTDEVPDRGVEVINRLLDAYNRFNLSAKNQLAANTLNFMNERLRKIEAELDSIESRIQQFKSNQGVVDVSEQGKLYLQNVSESERKAADINGQLALLDQVANYVRSGRVQTGIVPTSLGIDDPVLAQLLQRLNELELQYSNLRTTTGENNPLVKAVESEIAKIRPNIVSIVTNQRARLQATRRNINRTGSQIASQLRALPVKERALLEISRQQATKREVYAYLLQKREEAALTAAAVLSDTRVIDRAQANTTAAGYTKLFILVGAMMLALLATIVYIFFKEILSNRIMFRSSLEKMTSLPIAAEIIHNKRQKKFLSGKLRRLSPNSCFSYS